MVQWGTGAGPTRGINVFFWLRVIRGHVDLSFYFKEMRHGVMEGPQLLPRPDGGAQVRGSKWGHRGVRLR